MLFFSHLICRRLKGFVLSISAKLSHVSELNMRIPGLIMNFNQCFISSFFFLKNLKVFLSCLLKVQSQIFLVMKFEQMVMDCQRVSVLHLPLLLSLSYMIANRPFLLSQISVYIWADKCFCASFFFFPSFPPKFI